MRKLIAYILAAAMLCTFLTACGRQTDAPGSTAVQLPPEEEAELTRRLLADWYTYSVCCEVLCGDMLWALSYLDPLLGGPHLGQPADCPGGYGHRKAEGGVLRAAGGPDERGGLP